MPDNWEKIKNGQYVLEKDQRKKELAKDSQNLLKNFAKTGASFLTAYMSGLAMEPGVYDWPDLIHLGAIVATCAFGALTLYNVPKWMKSLLNVNKAPDEINKYPNDEFAEENIANIEKAKLEINRLLGEERRENIMDFLAEDVKEDKTR